MFNNYQVLKREVVCDNGCFQRTRYWLAGHIPGLEARNVVVRFIKGYTGNETEVTVDSIVALNSFMVVALREV